MSNTNKIQKDFNNSIKKLVKSKEYKKMMKDMKTIQSMFSAFSTPEEKSFIPILNIETRDEKFKGGLNNEIIEVNKNSFDELLKTKETTASVVFDNNFNFEIKKALYIRNNFLATSFNVESKQFEKNNSGEYLEVIIGGNIKDSLRAEIVDFINYITERESL